MVLEFQITSNVRLNNLSDLSRHPLKGFLRAGVMCVQGTDGCALYGTDPVEEELSLEKLLGLSFEELCRMRETDRSIAEKSRQYCQNKWLLFEHARGPLSPADYLSLRIAATEKATEVLWVSQGKLDAHKELEAQIHPLPEGKLPIVLAGGSFNNNQHVTKLNPQGMNTIDKLLRLADPEKCFFVVGHSCSGYERYLIQQNAGKFQIFSVVPTMISRSERDRLQKAEVRVRISIEPTGLGLYKSFAYEVFKRRPSVLLAFDGNSAAANLVQEAKNGREKSDIYIDGRCRALKAKAGTLQGYVTIFGPGDDPAAMILEKHGLK